jgi:WD40 repeat protein/serine/threonine protein kinase
MSAGGARATESGAAIDADALLDQFETAWKQTPFPDLESFRARLGARDLPEQKRLLVELIKIDLEHRWRRAEIQPPPADSIPARPRVEDYVRTFAELGPDVPLRLIREEYWVRHCWGDRPAVEEYIARFPAHESAVRAALAAADAELALEPGTNRDGAERPTAVDGVSTLAPGLLLGAYRLLARLGAGVTGQVFKARHEATGREVALKVIRPELLTSPDAIRRFFQEIEAVRRLSHPNVVQACDAGSAGATHYLAMEFFEGTDLDRLVKQSGPLDPDLAREYVRQVALGLAHIHEHGLVHRDIKPANLLIADFPAESAIRNPQSAIVKILDLGLARWHRAIDDPAYSTLTREGTVMGTPDYMAPEQAADARTADIRADIYSLGCTFYYLLTGRPPFPGGTFIHKVDQHRWATPTPVAELRPGLPATLSAVLARMMAKAPEDRFQTPAELAAALEPGTEIIEPSARPRAADGGATQILQPPPKSPALPPVPERKSRWPMVGALVALVAILAAVVIFLPPMVPRKNDPETKREPPPGVVPAASPFDALAQQGLPEAQHLAGQPPEAVAVLGDQRLRHWALVWSLAFNNDGRFLAVGGEERHVRIWDVKQSREAMALKAPHHVYALAYSPDGRFLATGGLGYYVTLWDAFTGHEKGRMKKRPPVPRSLTFTPDSRTLIGGDESGVCFWDVEKQEESRHWPQASIVYSVSCSADGRTLAAACGDGNVRLWDLEKRREGAVLPCSRGAVRAARFAPKGDLLAVGGADGAVQIWDMNASQPEPVILGRHGATVRTLAFSPDGNILASGTDGEDRSIILWDIARRRELAVLRPRHERAHEGVFTLAFSPDSKTLASGSPDGTVRLWDVAERRERSAVPPSWPVNSLAISADGKTLALGSLAGPGRIWDVATSAETILELPGEVSPTAALSADRGVFGGQVGVTFWDVATRRQDETIPVPGLPVLAAAFSPDSTLLATGSGDPHDRKKTGQLLLWDTRARRAQSLGPAHEASVTSVGFGFVPGAADSQRTACLASGGGDGLVVLWDVRERKELRRLVAHTAPVRAVTFAPDGTLASAGSDGFLRIWDVTKGKEKHAPLRARRGEFSGATWNPDGTRLAACEAEGTIYVWDVATNRVLVRDMPGPVNQVRFTPDGRYLLTGNANGTVTVLDLSRATVNSQEKSDKSDKR